MVVAVVLVVVVVVVVPVVVAVVVVVSRWNVAAREASHSGVKRAAICVTVAACIPNREKHVARWVVRARAGSKFPRALPRDRRRCR